MQEVIEELRSFSIGERVILFGFLVAILSGIVTVAWGIAKLIALYVHYCLHHPFVEVFGNSLLGLFLGGLLFAILGMLIVVATD